MKHFILKYLIYIAATIFIILAWATFALAGSIAVTPLEDPVVTPPQRTSNSWDGVYAGGALGVIKTRTRVNVPDTEIVGEECGDGYCDITVSDDVFQRIDNGGLIPWRTRGDGGCGFRDNNPFSCITGVNQLWLNGSLEIPDGSHIEHRTQTELLAGGFVGYRQHVSGKIVLGGELSAMQTFDSGRTLLTAEGQIGYDAGRALPYISGWTAGAGIDFALGRNWSAGPKVSLVDVGGTTAKVAMARIGVRF